MQVIKPDAPHELRPAADCHHAAAGCPQQGVQQQPGQREVPQMIYADLHFEAVGGFAAGRGHHPGVVQQNIQPPVVRAEGFSKIADRLLTRQVQRHDFQRCAGNLIQDVIAGGVGTLHAARRQNDVCAFAGQRQRAFKAQPAVGPGDDGGSTPLVGHVFGCPVFHCDLLTD